jgi:hypothetical protein
VAVTVSRVSVVDRMVSKEYVQTAHPYDRDLAPLGAWIEKRTFFQEPLAGDSNCVCDRHWNIGAPTCREVKKNSGGTHLEACLCGPDVAGSHAEAQVLKD